jgi:phosphoserine phosphatase RsbU/P
MRRYFYEFDISEIHHRQTEATLLATAENLRAILNSIGDAIITIDIGGSVTGMNPRAESLTGWKEREAIGNPLSELFQNITRTDNTIESPFDKYIGKVPTIGNLDEISVISRNGNEHRLLVSCAPIKDSSGEKTGVVLMFRDITAGFILQERIRLQSAALEASANAIVITDRNGLIELINPAFTKLTGYSQEEALGKNPRDLVNSGIHDVVFFKDIWDTILAGRVWHGDIINRRKDGSLYHEEQTIAPVPDAGGKISHFIAIKQDVTERKQSEEKLREQQLELADLNKQLEMRIGVQLAELHLAAQIQKNLLPNKSPLIAGYDIKALNIPANEVGGDYYDFIRLDDHRMVIVLGDVSGKGLSAALLMANLQAVIRSQALFDANPKECLERANNLLFHSTDSDKFVTLFYGILDSRANTLRYVNAGHNHPIVYSPGNIAIKLERSGLLLGAFENVSYTEEEIILNSDDQLLIYSDGISEAMNDKFEEFGEAKLLDIIRRNGTIHSPGLVEDITSGVEYHSGESLQIDDMTMILVKRT